MNVVIAAVLLLILGASFDGTAMDLDNGRASLVARLAATNIFLVVFNLIPAFPMDGGRVLRAVLAMRMGRANATRVAARIGQAAAFVFALAGLFVNPMLIVIGLFVYLAASAEAQHVAFQDGTHELSVREAMVSPIDALSPGATLDEAIDLLIRTSQKEFPVVDAQSRPRGLLTKDAIIRALRDGGPATPVVDVMVAVPSMPQWRPLDAGLIALNQSKAPALCIVDETERLVGLLTPENVGEMMLVRSVRPDFRFRRRRIAA